MGAQPTVIRSLVDDYLHDFYARASWHLFWTLILVSAALLLFVRDKSLSRPAYALFGLFLASQVFIFQFSNQGQWAEDGTAINRLPLHFAPALLFAAVLITNSIYQRLKPQSNQSCSSLTGALYLGLPVMGGLIISAALGWGLLHWLYPTTGGYNRSFEAEDFRLAIGSGER